ncbi:MAG: ABC transporter ATP-binding protein [Ilumatobacteraceae bacterium]
MKLVIEHVGFRIDDRVVLDDIQLDVPSGSMVGLVGPNGSGKSTLLRLLAGAITPQTGIVWVDDQRLWELDRRRSSELVVEVDPDRTADLDGTVGDLLSAAGGEGGATTVDHLLVAAGLTELRGRRLAQLSSGERHRAVLARALARRPSVLLMDEPEHRLDVRARHELLGFVHRVAVTTIVALGDLNLAGAYCDRVVVLAGGRVAGVGTAAEVLVPEIIGAAFGIDATVVVHPRTQRPQLLFHPRGGDH